MARTQVLCHGDDRRFDEVADLISAEFGPSVSFIADVAGGCGLLSRILKKWKNYTT